MSQNSKKCYSYVTICSTIRVENANIEVKTMQTAVDLQSYALQRRPQVGQRVRQARRENGWTQERIALYLGCSRRRVNRVERGITEFTLFELELLAKEFGVPITYFLVRDEYSQLG
jgi:ribosome-binding protein aMBF1 (putative translation factor)